MLLDLTRAGLKVQKIEGQRRSYELMTSATCSDGIEILLSLIARLENQ
jgi:hypothetical protein